MSPNVFFKQMFALFIHIELQGLELESLMLLYLFLFGALKPSVLESHDEFPL